MQRGSREVRDRGGYHSVVGVVHPMRTLWYARRDHLHEQRFRFWGASKQIPAGYSLVAHSYVKEVMIFVDVHCTLRYAGKTNGVGGFSSTNSHLE